MGKRRTQPKEIVPDLIIASDLHLRFKQPVCWQDDYVEAQTRALERLCTLQEQYGCPVLLAGDIFEHWKAPPDLELYAWRNLPANCFVVAGQHDLKYNTMDGLYESSLGVLIDAGRVHLLEAEETDKAAHHSLDIAGASWDEPIPEWDWDVLVMHRMTWTTEPYPGITEGNAYDLLRQLSKEKPRLIITGDNHQGFVIDDGMSCLINPGSFMIQRASEMDHSPSIYLWSVKSWTQPERVELWSKDNPTYSVSRDHIDFEKKREEQLTSFVSTLVENQEVGLSFEDNMAQVLFDAPKNVRLIVYECMDVDAEEMTRRRKRG